MWYNALQCDAMWCDVMQCDAALMQCDLMWCNVMKWDAVRCSNVQLCDAMWCNVKQWDSRWCNAMQCDAMCSYVMQYDAMRFNVKEWDSMWCNAMQCDAMCSYVMQYDAMRFNVKEWDSMWCNVKQCDAMWSNVMYCKTSMRQLPFENYVCMDGIPQGLVHTNGPQSVVRFSSTRCYHASATTNPRISGNLPYHCQRCRLMWYMSPSLYFYSNYYSYLRNSGRADMHARLKLRGLCITSPPICVSLDLLHVSRRADACLWTQQPSMQPPL